MGRKKKIQPGDEVIEEIGVPIVKELTRLEFLQNLHRVLLEEGIQSISKLEVLIQQELNK